MRKLQRMAIVDCWYCLQRRKSHYCWLLLPKPPKEDMTNGKSMEDCLAAVLSDGEGCEKAIAMLFVVRSRVMVTG